MDEKERLKSVAKEAREKMTEEQEDEQVVAQLGQVTEVTIRCGSPDAIRVLQGDASSVTESSTSSTTDNSHELIHSIVKILDSNSKQLLKAVVDETGKTSEAVIADLYRQIAARQVAEEIEEYAKQLGVANPEEQV